MSIQNLQNKCQELRDQIRKARALADKYEGSQKGLSYERTVEDLFFKCLALEEQIEAHKANIQAHDPLA